MEAIDRLRAILEGTDLLFPRPKRAADGSFEDLEDTIVYENMLKEALKSTIVGLKLAKLLAEGPIDSLAVCHEFVFFRLYTTHFDYVLEDVCSRLSVAACTKSVAACTLLPVLVRRLLHWRHAACLCDAEIVEAEAEIVSLLCFTRQKNE